MADKAEKVKKKITRIKKRIKGLVAKYKARGIKPVYLEGALEDIDFHAAKWLAERKKIERKWQAKRKRRGKG